MRKLMGLALVVLIPAIAFAADPTVVQNAQVKNFNNTLTLGCGITAAPNQTIQSAQAVWRNKGDTNWVVGCFLGNSPGPYTGTTINTFTSGQKIETAIMVIVQDQGGFPRQTGALDIKAYTVP